MTQLFGDLSQHRFLRGLMADEFAAEVAQFLAELNAIHPFRDGNGRSQMTFLTVFADAAGHPLSFSRLEPEGWLDAMMESFHGNTVALTGQVHRLLRG